MEKKNMDKIDILYDYAKNNRNKLIERLGSLTRSFYTDDMKEILKTIMQHDSGYYIYIPDTKIKIDFWSSYRDFRLGINSRKLQLFNFFEKNYNIATIDRLEREIRDEKNFEEKLSFIEDNMEKIMLTISNTYKEISEKEGGKLDELLNQINYDVAPTKHLKITVEWI